MGLLALAAGLTPAPAAAGEAEGLVSVGIPAGFERLSESAELLVDVYFRERRIGEARVKAKSRTIELQDVHAAIASLPSLRDQAAVTAALGGSNLASNTHLVCAGNANSTECGRLSPEVAGVIFDRDRFRLDVFVNPRFLADEGRAEVHLPRPERGVGIISTFSALLAGQSDRQADYYTVQNRLIVGSGARRLRANMMVTRSQKLGFDDLAVEWDRPGVRYLAGAIWAPGGDFVSRRKFVGAGVQSQIDTRADREQLAGSPLVAYLDRRSRVDVILDGRLIHSAIYEAGTRHLDTASLPYGSYNVTIRVQEPGGAPREERRFFSKGIQVPTVGRTDFFAYGGWLVRDPWAGSVAPSDEIYAQGAVIHRLSENWAIEGLAELAGDAGTTQVGATYLTSFARFRAAALVDSVGEAGGVIQVTSSGASSLNFNFDIRHISGLALSKEAQWSSLGGTRSQTAGHYSQASGVISYGTSALRFLGTFVVRDSAASETQYSIGPSIEWDVLRSGPATLALRTELTATENGEAAFAGISLRFSGTRTSFNSRVGARRSSIADDTFGDGLISQIAGAWTTDLGRGEVALGAGYDRYSGQRSAVVSADLHHPQASIAVDVTNNRGEAGSSTQYSLGLQSTLIAGPGMAAVAGRTTSESVIVVRAEGAREDDRFEVLVNDHPMAVLRGTTSANLNLPSYRSYEVRLKPIGARLLAYDNAPRSVTLYPGSVARLSWTTSPVTITFAQLVTADGEPVRYAAITGKSVWAETDEDGFFQLEADENSALTVTTNDGASFPLKLPLGSTARGIARLGPVTCCGATTSRLGVLLGPSADFTGAQK